MGTKSDRAKSRCPQGHTPLEAPEKRDMVATTAADKRTNFQEGPGHTSFPDSPHEHMKIPCQDPARVTFRDTHSCEQEEAKAHDGNNSIWSHR